MSQKTAEPDPRLNEYANYLMRQEALGDIGRTAALMFGAGVAGRGLVGLMKPTPKATKTRPSIVQVGVPYPVAEDEDAAAPRKTADVADWAARQIPGAQDLKGFFSGRQAGSSSKFDLPYYLTAMSAAGIGGGAGGYLLADRLLVARRKAQEEERLNKAKRNFQAALLEPYEQPYEYKAASADPDAADMAEAGAALDRAYETISGLVETGVKTAAGEQTAGFATGLYGAGASLVALLSGAYAYNSARKHSNREALDRAVARHRQMTAGNGPTPLYAVPEPVTVPRTREDDEAELQKAAAERVNYGPATNAPKPAYKPLQPTMPDKPNYSGGRVLPTRYTSGAYRPGVHAPSGHAAAPFFGSAYGDGGRPQQPSRSYADPRGLVGPGPGSRGQADPGDLVDRDPLGGRGQAITLPDQRFGTGIREHLEGLAKPPRPAPPQTYGRAEAPDVESPMAEAAVPNTPAAPDYPGEAKPGPDAFGTQPTMLPKAAPPVKAQGPAPNYRGPKSLIRPQLPAGAFDAAEAKGPGSIQ